MGETFRCSCGSSARANSKPPGLALALVNDLRGSHLSEGHREVDAKEFARIRASQRRAEAKAIEAAMR